MRTKNNNKRFAVIICGKDTARLAFRINPDTFDISDERIREVKGWFFPKDAERRIHITPENGNLILQCVKHAYETSIE